MNLNLKERFPPREQIMLVFASIAFPQYTWTTFWVLDYLPSWLKSMTFWETIPINAYAYAWVFLESLVILFILLMLAISMPEKWFRRNFVSKSSLAVWLIFMFSFATQLKNTNKFDFMAGIKPEIILLVSALISFFLLSKSQKFHDIIISITDRLTVFLYIYIPISAISTIIVLYNNLRF
jgi:hypothetical protein